MHVNRKLLARARARAARREERSDEELMQALAAGDAGALDVLLARHWSGLVSFAYRFLQDQDAAEDIAQETFVRLWERRAEWQRTGSVRSFFYLVARNLALNETRARRLRRKRQDQVAAEACHSLPSAVDSVEESELRRAVQAAIAVLPERRREVFVLARYHDLTYAEIAEALGISPQTVANQMSAALATLREQLGLLLPPA